MSDAEIEPHFDRAVPPGGYAWWYLDALSDDGEDALTVIGFVGSVFSPYYAWSGRRDPEAHVSMNVALYGRRIEAWAMTERDARALGRSAKELRIGPSAMRVKDGVLEVELDEVGFPRPRRVKGVLRLRPTSRPEETFALDPEGQHHWRPIAPRARIEVELEHPGIRFEGDAYLDSNWGAVPLEQTFQDWTWSRAAIGERAIVLYDVQRRDGSRLELGLDIGPSGAITRFPLPPRARLPRSGWGIERHAHGDDGSSAALLRTLEDTPFYARSLVESTLRGTRLRSVHESLSLDRLGSRWVKLLLPFRMPRVKRHRRPETPGP